ncbi:MAG: restriction endonuclease subunit S [Wenzhouxiangellaceae bacterium]
MTTTPETRLLDLYDRVAEAPDAIERLRKFVLDLAVRGKLVEQDEGDEPAGELLKRISEKRKQLDLKCKKSPLASEDEPFQLPENWRWTRVGAICAKTGSGSTPRGGKSVYKSSGIPFLRSQNVHNDGLRMDDVAYIDQHTHERMIGTGVLSGDLLLNITGGSIGRCAQVPEDFGDANVSQHVAIIRPAIRGLERYLHNLILAPYFQSHILSSQTGAGRGGLPKYRMDTIPVALPPLPEQHRIVAKLDELMALLDRLESTRTKRETTRDRLTTASLTRLTAPDTTEEDFPGHARFALENLEELISRPEQIKVLRQTILNLAVRGELVEQDPADEPAEELLKKIAQDKEHRAVSARDRRASLIKPIVSTDAPFDIPLSWVWAAFGDITISRDGERVPVSKAERENRAKIYDYYGASGVIDKIDGYLFDRPLLLIGEDGANLINRSTPIAFIARGKYWVNNHAHVLDGLDEEYLRFLALFINAIDLKPFVTGTAQPKMNQAKMNSIPVALPPLPEQHRILATVDALMSLCNQLDSALDGADSSRARLLEVLLHDSLAQEARNRAAA